VESIQAEIKPCSTIGMLPKSNTKMEGVVARISVEAGPLADVIEGMPKLSAVDIVTSDATQWWSHATPDA